MQFLFYPKNLFIVEVFIVEEMQLVQVEDESGNSKNLVSYLQDDLWVCEVA